MNAGVLVSSLLIQSVPTHGQATMAGDEIFFELLKHDMRQARTDVVRDVMMLSVDDADSFWPIYQRYQTELDKILDARGDLVKQFTGIHLSMTNQQGEELALEWLDLQSRQASLTRTLYERLARALSPVQALKAVQLEHRLNLVIDMQIANELPMME